MGAAVAGTTSGQFRRLRSYATLKGRDPAGLDQMRTIPVGCGCGTRSRAPARVEILSGGGPVLNAESLGSEHRLSAASEIEAEKHRR